MDRPLCGRKTRGCVVVCAPGSADHRSAAVRGVAVACTALKPCLVLHDVCCYAAELIEHDVNQESFQLSAAATDFFIFSSLEPLCLHHLESKKYTFTHDVT